MIPPVLNADTEAEIEKLLKKAQWQTQLALVFYPMAISAMVLGLKANRLGANGRGTKYIVAGVVCIAILCVLAILVVVIVVLMMHAHINIDPGGFGEMS